MTRFFRSSITHAKQICCRTHYLATRPEVAFHLDLALLHLKVGTFVTAFTWTKRLAYLLTIAQSRACGTGKNEDIRVPYQGRKKRSICRWPQQTGCAPSVPAGTWVLFLIENPALKRWAIFSRKRKTLNTYLGQRHRIGCNVKRASPAGAGRFIFGA